MIAVTLRLRLAARVKNYKVSRDGSAKKYTNKDSRENNRQGAPYTLFLSNRVSIKKSLCRDAPFPLVV